MEHLLPKIDGMLPEGVGKRSAFVKTGPAARLTNELLENAKLTVDKLWKQRGYDPKKPEVIQAKLGYACDQYEASAYLVTGALHKPLISHEEAKYYSEVHRQAHPQHHRQERLSRQAACAAAQAWCVLGAADPDTAAPASCAQLRPAAPHGSTRRASVSDAGGDPAASSSRPAAAATASSIGPTATAASATTNCAARR